MDNITRIRQNLKDGGYATNPAEAAADKAILAGEYSWVMSQLEDVLQRKPAAWVKLREGVKSDTAAERAWEKTDEGFNETALKLRARGIEKMMSALSSLIRVAEGEQGKF